MNGSLDQREVEEIVLGYLAEHPQAMDTLEGIAEWWVERRQVRLEIEAVRKALERLVERGALEKVLMISPEPGNEARTTSQPLYRLKT